MKLIELKSKLDVLLGQAEEDAKNNFCEISEDTFDLIGLSEDEYEQAVHEVMRSYKNAKWKHEFQKELLKKATEEAKKSERAALLLKSLLEESINNGVIFKFEDVSLHWGSSESVEVEDGKEAPDAFYKTERKLNKSKLKEFVKAGNEIEGVKLVKKYHVVVK